MTKRPLLLLALTLLMGMVSTVRADSVIAVPSPASLAAAGGQISVAVDIVYQGQPSALGLALSLPEGWSVAGVSGKNAPPIASEAGSTESAELAWLSPPADGASLVLELNYPAGTTVRVLSGYVEIRRSGKSMELKLAVPLKA